MLNDSSSLVSYKELLRTQDYDRSARSDAADERFVQCFENYEGQLLSAKNIVLLGVPQHIGVERNGGRIGAAEAPEAIRSQLFKLSTSTLERHIGQDSGLINMGDLKVEGCSLEEIHERLGIVLRSVLSSGAFCIVLGGGHDIAWPNGRAVQELHNNMSFINVDAHPDVRPLVEWEAELRTHSGSPFRQLLESAPKSVVDGSCSLLGVQPFTAAMSHLNYLRQFGHSVLSLQNVRQLGIAAAYTEAIARAQVATDIYCSFDIDAVSGAWAPGVSAVAVDGFAPADMFQMVRIASSSPSCRLIDFVEVNPRYDQDNRTAKLVAQLVAAAIDERSSLLAGS